MEIRRQRYENGDGRYERKPMEEMEKGKRRYPRYKEGNYGRKIELSRRFTRENKKGKGRKGKGRKRKEGE